MAERVHRIHSLDDEDPAAPGSSSPDRAHPVVRGIDRVLHVQRPLVLAHLRSIRLRSPHADGERIVRILERRYLAGITAGGAAVGATAVVPGIGTGVTLALSGAETLGFLESTALFAQSLAEVHGIHVTDPDRARALVLTLMLGTEGTNLLRQFTAQARGKGAGRDAFWGELITKSLPRAAVGPLADRLKSAFVKQFAARGGASVIGKAVPFGIGAVIGGGGNHLLGRRVVAAARKAFPPAPAVLPAELEPRPGARRIEHIAGSAAARAGRLTASAAVATARGVATTGKRIAATARRPGRRSDESPEGPPPETG